MNWGQSPADSWLKANIFSHTISRKWILATTWIILEVDFSLIKLLDENQHNKTVTNVAIWTAQGYDLTASVDGEFWHTLVGFSTQGLSRQKSRFGWDWSREESTSSLVQLLAKCSPYSQPLRSTCPWWSLARAHPELIKTAHISCHVASSILEPFACFESLTSSFAISGRKLSAFKCSCDYIRPT